MSADFAEVLRVGALTPLHVLKNQNNRASGQQSRDQNSESKKTTSTSEMASFVQEVLLASGKLNEKEDFNAKACRLKNKVDDLKSSLKEKIESRYVVRK